MQRVALSLNLIKTDSLSSFEMVHKQKLTEELYFYLMQHNFLHLPGLGECRLKKMSASVDSETRLLLPPSYTIEFTPSDSGTHRELFSYLAEKLNITEVDAIMMVNNYAMELKYLLQRDGFALIEFIGKLFLNESGILCLEAQLLNVNFLSQSVPDTLNVDNIVTVNPEEEEDEIETNNEEVEIIEEVKENSNWKMSLLILASVAIIIFVLSRFIWTPSQLMGLQNPIQVKLPLLQHN